jgi:hypothetical protein
MLRIRARVSGGWVRNIYILMQKKYSILSYMLKQCCFGAVRGLGKVVRRGLIRVSSAKKVVFDLKNRYHFIRVPLYDLL